MTGDGAGRRVVGLAVALGAAFAAAAVGGVATSAALPEWYSTLAKPRWTPPDAVFGPVWTLLYLSMGVASWLVWRAAGRAGARAALALYGVQLVLNAGWSLVFFGARRPGLAMLEIAALWVAILATTVAFLRVRRSAGLLMVPYLLWVTFAAALNAAIWRLN